MSVDLVQPLAAPPPPRPPAVAPLTVLLGPFIDLHHGYHGSIRSDPPAAVEIHARGGDHLFGFPETPGGDDRFAPFDRPHLGELIDLGPGPQLVHSPRWPVVRRRAWTVDLDDLGYPALLGRHVFGERFRSAADGWSEGERAVAAQRFANTMTAFAHPSCRAVFFWTRQALEQAMENACRYVRAELADRVWPKCRILYPAQRSLLRSLVVDKWRRPEPLRIVFVGNDHRVKQGELALEVLERLAEAQPSVHCSYVGALPETLRFRAVRTELLGEIRRDRLLALLARSHVLFHPAATESFGMALLEAAAQGMAVVVGSGAGMAHLDELFRHDEARRVPRAPGMSRQEQARAFEEALAELVREPERARALGMAAHRRVADGPFDPASRNAVLDEVWRRALSAPPAEPLTPEDLPCWNPAAVARIPSAELAEAFRAYVEQHEIDRRNFYFRAW